MENKRMIFVVIRYSFRPQNYFRGNSLEIGDGSYWIRLITHLYKLLPKEMFALYQI